MAATYGSPPIRELTQPESFEEYPKHDSRGAGEALSRLASNIPFIGQLKQGLGLLLIQAYSPILKPFEIINVLTNHMFSRLAPGLADKSYELLYKVIPTGMISKAAGKIGLGGGISNQVSKFVINILTKTGVKTSDDNIKALINELVKSLSDMYNPQFLKQFDHFFTRALREGERPYMEVANVLIERALVNIGETATEALSKGISAIGENNTQKPAPDKQTQSHNNPKPGLLTNLSATGSNIFKSITGIFSPKPAPVVAA
jgi:hypothetical protein